MSEAISQSAQTNEGRQVGSHQQGSEEGFGLRDEKVGSSLGNGQRT
jgi:hypothetical protein